MQGRKLERKNKNRKEGNNRQRRKLERKNEIGKKGTIGKKENWEESMK